MIDDQGEITAETKLASEVEEIAFFCRVSSVGLEAGMLTQCLTYGLQSAGFEVICMEARQVKAALSAMRNKTHKHDARGIAQILRSGWYSRVHVKSTESHHIRSGPGVPSLDERQRFIYSLHVVTGEIASWNLGWQAARC